MKKCKNKIKKNNSYFLGGLIDKSTGELNKLGNLTNVVSDIGTSLIPSSGNAKTDAIVNGVAGGLEAVGSAFGPIGGVIGKAAGFLTKGIGAMVGTSDSVNTETGEYTKGKGIKGRRSRNRVLAQWRRVNQGIDDTNQGAAMAEEYANEYAGNDYSLAAYGGTLPTTMAYVDDGELLRTPDGKISEIPEEGKPTDSNLINVPVGTQVLSDKLKVPGTNKTFAQMGKKYMKTGNKKGSDIYAQNSQKLNDWNNQKKYNDLLALQESLKNKKGIKNNISKFEYGTPGISTTRQQRQQMKDWFVRINPNYNPNITHSIDNAKKSWYDSSNIENYELAGAAIRKFLSDKANYDKAYKDLSTLPQISKNLKSGMNFTDAVITNVSDGLYGQVHDYFDIQDKPFEKTNPTGKPDPGYAKRQTQFTFIAPISGKNYTSVVGNNPNDKYALNFKYTGPEKIDPSRGFKPLQKQDKLNNFIDGLANYGAALMGPLANIRNSNPEQARMFTYSPHFAPVEYDITDQINSANESAAISRYNADRIGGAGRGASLAQSIQSQIARDNAIYNLYNQKNNIENERMARNTGIYNDWARYNSEMQHRAYEEDAQNRAAARNIRNTGISQLGTAMQSISRDKRLNAKDQAMLEYMREFFNYGSTKDTVDRLYKQMR